MAKIFALGAYFYQAALAFGLLIAVAHVLAPGDYGAYSLFISTTQFGAIALFEWIRFACSRFYPGQAEGSEAAQRRVILVEFALSASLCSIIALGSMAFGVSPVMALLGAGVAIFQGGSDLQLTMLRFRQNFKAFSWLQGSRASFLAIGTLLGAVLGKSFDWTAAGLFGGYLAYAASALVIDRHIWSRSGPWTPAVLRQHFVYGSVAAGSSVLALLAPLGLKLILTASLGAHGAAGVLLALDLLQRPFVLIVSALQAIQYPEIVAAHDRQLAPVQMAPLLGQYYGLLISLTLIVAAGVWAILWPVAMLAVTPDMRDGFMQTAVLVLGFSALRGLTQNMSSTPAHLTQNLAWLIGLALADCVFFNVMAFAGAQLFGASPVAIIGGALLGAILSGLIGIRLLLSMPFRLPAPPVAIAATAVLAAALLSVAPLGNPWLASLAAVIVAGGLSLGALYGFYLTMRQPQAA